MWKVAWYLLQVNSHKLVARLRRSCDNAQQWPHLIIPEKAVYKLPLFVGFGLSLVGGGGNGQIHNESGAHMGFINLFAGEI